MDRRWRLKKEGGGGNEEEQCWRSVYDRAVDLGRATHERAHHVLSRVCTKAQSSLDRNSSTRHDYAITRVISRARCFNLAILYNWVNWGLAPVVLFGRNPLREPTKNKFPFSCWMMIPPRASNDVEDIRPYDICITPPYISILTQSLYFSAGETLANFPPRDIHICQKKNSGSLQFPLSVS